MVLPLAAPVVLTAFVAEVLRRGASINLLNQTHGQQAFDRPGFGRAALLEDPRR